MSNHEAIEESLLTELQSHGVRLTDDGQRKVIRKGGAGPTDHQAMTIGDTTLMVPVYSDAAWRSPFTLSSRDGVSELARSGQGNKVIPIAEARVPDAPRFYERQTADGIPYQQIATLHSRDVLATTVLQTCIRYESRRKACKFCSIGQSLRAGRTIAEKRPEHLAEVAKAAVELDGVTQMILTTGTPATSDRGAKVLAESARAIKAAVDLPIQAQCEPPADVRWYQRLKDAGVDALGMHLEVLGEDLRREILPGKAEDTLEDYYAAFAEAVKVFGRGQVSTYILAGLGDSAETILSVSEKLIALGVYPFVVPFVPVRGTPLEDHPTPSAEFMRSILAPLADSLVAAGMTSDKSVAGCNKCGACSTLAGFEQRAAAKS